MAVSAVCEANNSWDEGKKGSSNVFLDGRKSCFNMAKCVTPRDNTMSSFERWYKRFIKKTDETRGFTGLRLSAEPPADSKFLSLLRISEFFRFI